MTHEHPEWIRNAAKSVAALFITEHMAKKAMTSTETKLKADALGAEHKISEIINRHFAEKK